MPTSTTQHRLDIVVITLIDDSDGSVGFFVEEHPSPWWVTSNRDHATSMHRSTAELVISKLPARLAAMAVLAEDA